MANDGGIWIKVKPSAGGTAEAYVKTPSGWEAVGTGGPSIDDILPPGYTSLDCHVFVANGGIVNLPCVGLPTFVAVNNVDVTPTTLATRTVEVPDFENRTADGEVPAITQEVQVASVSASSGDTVHAIFDWDNASYSSQTWFSDILQFGLNSETGKRNQLKNGVYAFRDMPVNPEALPGLDTSNLVSMYSMFWYSSFNSDLSQWDTSNVNTMFSMFSNCGYFNQNISGWDTSSVTDAQMGGMTSMFSRAGSFDQDLSEWCVSKIAFMPGQFDLNSGFQGQTAKQPVWGTCPRGEDQVP